MAESDAPSGDDTRDGTVLPLAEAAARLGLSRDALRMRIRRGKARGFKRGRQLFVWLEDTAAEAPARAAEPQAVPDRGQRAKGLDRGRDREAGPGWPLLVEQQRQEIARLIQETDRLNARLERHLEEAREMRQMLQREQVLRQQELALHRDVQALLRRLVGQPGLASALGEAALDTPLGTPEAVAAAAESTEPGAPGLGQDLAEMVKEIGRSLREVEAKEPPERG